MNGVKRCTRTTSDGTTCGAFFVMRKHRDTGRPAPITTQEHDDGNIALTDDGSYRLILPGEHYQGPRYYNHYTDCLAEVEKRVLAKTAKLTPRDPEQGKLI